MAVDPHTVNLLHVVGEEIGDLFIGRPVDRNAQFVAVLGLELVLELRQFEPVRPEPVEIGELLVGQLIQLSIGRRGEALADEIVDVERRQSDVLAFSSHEIR